MSVEQKKYLRRIRFNKIFILSMQIIIMIFIIFIWQYLSDKKIINSFITSSPKKIIMTIKNLYKTNNLFKHIYVTTYEVFISFILSTLIGFFTATLLYFNKNISKILEPYFTILNSLPKVALGPIILIWCGANIKSIILMAMLVSVVITIINIYQGFINVDQNKVKLMKSFKASNIQIFIKLIIPNSYKNIISTIKISISMCLIGLLPPVGEKTFFNKCYSRY